MRIKQDGAELEIKIQVDGKEVNLAAWGEHFTFPVATGSKVEFVFENHSDVVLALSLIYCGISVVQTKIRETGDGFYLTAGTTRRIGHWIDSDDIEQEDLSRGVPERIKKIRLVDCNSGMVFRVIFEPSGPQQTGSEWPAVICFKVAA